MAGRASLNVGKETEQLVARYLRSRGLAGVERAVRTGFRTAQGRSVADSGDLTGWPGVCVQVKSLREKRAGRDPNGPMELAVPTWLAELEQQRAASGSSVGLLVVRRWGGTNVGRWWCFLTAWELFGLMDGQNGTPAVLQAAAVRLELSDVVTMMQTWGWAPCPAAEPLEGTH